LVLRATGGEICVFLGGRVKEKIVEAPSLSHTWIADGTTIRPLPADTSAVVGTVLVGRDPEEITFSDVLRLRDSGELPLDVELDSSLFRTANLLASEEVIELSVPGLEASLYPYQAQGVRWMQETLARTGGLILADEMGLGKTMQIISLLLLDPPCLMMPVLIVCPTTLIANWARELSNFAPSLSVMIHRGADRTGVATGLQRAQIVISTYDTIVNDVALFGGFEWSWVICDEAQAIKNPASQRRNALSSVPRRYSIPVTGTPMENTLVDLWSLVDFAVPGLLGPLDEFRERFPDSEGSAEELSQRTDPIVLKRRIKDVGGDLPDRIDIDLPIELGDRLSTRYDKVRSEALESYGRAGALVACGRLALFCAHPWLAVPQEAKAMWDEGGALSPHPDCDILTPKLEVTAELLKEAFAAGKKVLVFAAYNGCGELVKRSTPRFASEFWGAINGSTPESDRQVIVDQFSDHVGPGCLVLNPRAAGAGLNITCATVVIHFTQVWNPALEAQASARAHRRGQDQPVTIYRPYYTGTIDEVMVERAAWKRQISNLSVPISTRDEVDLGRALDARPTN